MAEIITVSNFASYGGTQDAIGANSTLTTAGKIIQKTQAIAAATVGSLDTRTSDTAGIISSVGHGFADTDTIAIFWADGSRYNVDIDSVTSDTITFSLGSGDVLPIATTALTFSVATEIDTCLDGDNVKCFTLNSTVKGVGVFSESDGTAIVGYNLAANKPHTEAEGFSWVYASENPLLAADVTTIKAYNSSESAGTISIGIAYDN